MKLIRFIAACASALAISTQAQTFTQVPIPVDRLNANLINLDDGATYAPLFPGNKTLGGVPFVLQQNDIGNNAFWNGTLDLLTNISGASTVYTLINTTWGATGSNVGSISFFGSGGTVETFSLIVGDNVRDHLLGDFVNTTTANYVSQNVVGVNVYKTAHLDMQAFSLSAAFQNEQLTGISFFSEGGYPQGTPFLAGLTVAAVPEPSSYAMLLAGLGMLGFLARRRTPVTSGSGLQF